MARKKKAVPKPYPSKPGERGLFLRWWRERDATFGGNGSRPADDGADADSALTREDAVDRPVERYSISGASAARS